MVSEGALGIPISIKIGSMDLSLRIPGIAQGDSGKSLTNI